MNIFSKIFNKDIKDIYEAVKGTAVMEILHGGEDLYVTDAANNKIKLNVPERRVAADAIQSIAKESNIQPRDGETVEEYVLRAAMTDILQESEELTALRKQAEEAGV